MDRVLGAVISATIVVLAGCGGGDGSKGSTPTGRSAGATQAGSTAPGARDTPKRKVAPPKSGAKRAGGRLVFEQARNACATSGVAQIAATFKIRGRDPTDVARSYARKVYDPPRRAEAFKGCLVGFK